MAAPYLDASGAATDHSGRLFIEPEELAEAGRRLGAEGFQLHFHAIGDLAGTTALDALAALPADSRREARHHPAPPPVLPPRGQGAVARLRGVAQFPPPRAGGENRWGGANLPFA